MVRNLLEVPIVEISGLFGHLDLAVPRLLVQKGIVVEDQYVVGSSNLELLVVLILCL